MMLLRKLKFEFHGPDAEPDEFAAAFKHASEMRANLAALGYADVIVAIRRVTRGEWEFPMQGRQDRCSAAKLALEKVSETRGTMERKPAGMWLSRRSA